MHDDGQVVDLHVLQPTVPVGIGRDCQKFDKGPDTRMLVGLRGSRVIRAGAGTARRSAQRRVARLARATAPPAAAEALAARPFPIVVPEGAIVCGFMPLKSEINPLPLLRKLADAGARLALAMRRYVNQPTVAFPWNR